MKNTITKKTTKKTAVKKNVTKHIPANAKKNTTLQKKTAEPAKKKTPLTSHYFDKVQPQEIALDLIEANPLNQRKFIDKGALQELSCSIQQYGLFHNIGVCPTSDGRYRLVFGYRRTLASRMAGHTKIFAKVAIVPDEHIKEIILSENIHHESQHPIDEALAIQSMLADGKKPGDIALRLGKSRSFVDTRIKLLQLSDPLQEMFFYNKLLFQDALLLATLSEESQQDFFEQNCTDWQNHPCLTHEEVQYFIHVYSYDLQLAPFDKNSKTLVTGKGACTGCQFNSATLTTLFPEEQDKQFCKDKKCYENKCTAHYSLNITTLALQEKPAAIILGSPLSATAKNAVETLDCIKDLPQYSPYHVTPVFAPPAPDQQEYTFAENGNDAAYFDEVGYKCAVSEHAADMETFNRMLATKEVIKGLEISNHECNAIYFTLGEIKQVKSKVSAKQVQQAIKNGTDTPELLEAAIERTIQKRDQLRNQVVIETQQHIVNTFRTHVSTFSNNRSFTSEDTIAVRLLIYQTLSAGTQTTANAVLGIPASATATELLDQLKALNEVQFAYLTRIALAEKADAELSPVTICTERLAASAGIDIDKIKQDSENAAATRENLLNQRVDLLKARITEITKEAA